MGVAIRTKKPLDLHLAPLVWKQLCCIPLQLEDLEEVDLLYVQTLKSILHIEDSGITEDNFHEVRDAFGVRRRSCDWRMHYVLKQDRKLHRCSVMQGINKPQLVLMLVLCNILVI